MYNIYFTTSFEKCLFAQFYNSLEFSFVVCLSEAESHYAAQAGLKLTNWQCHPMTQGAKAGGSL